MKNLNNLFYITQTTLSINDTEEIISALRQRCPFIKGPKNSDICYATINRQEAVRNLAITSDIIFVIGSKNSSNFNRLVELVQNMGKLVYLKLMVLMRFKNFGLLMFLLYIGITAGVSAPDILVTKVIE